MLRNPLQWAFRSRVSKGGLARARINGMDDMTTHGRILAGAAIALAMPMAEASAQSAVSLSPLVVSAPAAEETSTDPVTGYVAKTTATGAKTDTPVTEVPQSVSVIGREEMDDRGATKIDEALRYTPGVFAQPFGPDSDTNWLFIRGFQATATGTYQDGLQNFSYAFGSFFTDSFNIERIEVLRGASSVLYGGSNPGGLVNYVSKRPTGERLRYMELGINDAGTAFTGFDIGDKAGDDMSYRVTGKIQGGDGYSDEAEGFRGTISPSVNWKPNDRNEVTFLANYTYIDETHNGGAFLPYVGTVVDAPFGKIDPDANFTEPDIDKYVRRQFSAGYEFSHYADDDLTFRQNFRYGHSELHEISVYPFGYNGFSATPDATNTLSRVNFEHDTSVNTVLLDNQLEKKFATGPVAHTLLGGVDYKYFGMEQVQASGSATTISATDPQYGAEQGDRSAYIDQQLTMHQVGFYAQDQLRFGDGWLVTLNGRYDRVRNLADGTPSYDGNDGQWSGRAGLAYTFAGGVTPYASYSTFFNPVLGTSAVDGSVFKPETGKQYEIGVKYAPTWIDGLFTVALFDLTRQNVVTGSGVTETQLGEVNSQGFEAEARINVTKNLKATGAFTILDLDITKDADASIVGNQPYIVPERMASVSADYTFDHEDLDGVLKGVTVGGGVRYVGSSWADNANTLKVPSATVYDAKIGYAEDNWGVDLNVNNLFDKTYVAACQTEYSCAYAEGRTAMLKFHINW